MNPEIVIAALQELATAAPSKVQQTFWTEAAATVGALASFTAGVVDGAAIAAAPDDPIEAPLAGFAAAEMILRDAARLLGLTGIADLHGDRAQAFREAMTALHTAVATWRLSPKDSRGFVDNVLNPPEPNDALKAAVARRDRDPA